MLLDFLLYKKNRFILLIILCLLLLAALLIYFSLLLSQKTFYRGVVIDGNDVSGLMKHNAKELIEQSLQVYSDKEVILKYNDRIWNFSLNDILYTMLIEDVINQAYDMGRTGSITQRLRCIAGAMRNNVEFYCESRFDKNKLNGILSQIKKEIDTGENNASVSFNNGEIVIEKETIGKELNIDTNLKLVENKILRREFEDIELVVDQKIPGIVYEDIKEIKYVMSSFSTVFNINDSDRTHNLKLACDRINGVLLKPGKIFSMNNALGPRTIENGYREAPVIFKNELIKGPGGGICQVTTTLYVAALKARVSIVERSNHSMPLGYVSPGQDATIAEGSIDFKFQNNLTYDDVNYPICISAEVSGNKIITRFLGSRNNEDTVVKLKSEIIEEYLPEEDEIIIDNSIPDGEKVVVQKPRKGLKVAVYREVYSKNGEPQDREKISEDIYMPVRGQVKVNSMNYFGVEGEGENGDWKGTE